MCIYRQLHFQRGSPILPIEHASTYRGVRMPLRTSWYPAVDMIRKILTKKNYFHCESHPFFVKFVPSHSKTSPPRKMAVSAREAARRGRVKQLECLAAFDEGKPVTFAVSTRTHTTTPLTLLLTSPKTYSFTHLFYIIVTVLL